MEPYYDALSINWDISPDGQRFLMLKQGEATEDARRGELVVVQNWFDEVKERAPINQ